MKSVLFFVSICLGIFLSQQSRAQVIDVSKDYGCIADFNYQKADCYACRQEMPDGSGFCQPPQSQACPKCWNLVESYWDETLDTQVYTLTIDPDGIHIVKTVYSVSKMIQPWGVRLNFIEI